MSKEQKVSVILFKERRIIIFSVIIAIVASVAITFLIPKKYSSFTIIYPAKSNSLKDVAISPGFGYEIQADRLIQLIESQILQDSLVNKFNLLDYYELNESESDWRYKLNEYLSRDININRTRYLSIIITVTTKDPDLSANMANYISLIVDTIKENILKENTKLAVKLYNERSRIQTIKVDSLLNLIFSLSKETGGNQKDNNLYKKRKEEIKERQKTGSFTSADESILTISPKNQTLQTEKIINEYFHERRILYSIKGKHEESQDILDSPMPKSYIISEAKPDYRKVSPSLRTNLVIAIGVSLLSAILLIIVKYKYREIKEELN